MSMVYCHACDVYIDTDWEDCCRLPEDEEIPKDCPFWYEPKKDSSQP